MKNYNLPTRKECFDILAQYNVPEHIVKHCVTTAKLAVFIANTLKEKSVDLDVDLIDRACLLHDVMRMCDFTDSGFEKFEQGLSEDDKIKWQKLREKYGNMVHEEAAYEILKDRYPQVGSVIKKHRYMAMLVKTEKPSSWEEKIVYYADKRVMHEKIVSLKERLEEGHRRNTYQHGSDVLSRIDIAMVDPMIFRLEEEISEKADMDVAAITEEFINSQKTEQ
jgi:uncharacterized protein